MTLPFSQSSFSKLTVLGFSLLALFVWEPLASAMMGGMVGGGGNAIVAASPQHFVTTAVAHERIEQAALKVVPFLMAEQKRVVAGKPTGKILGQLLNPSRNVMQILDSENLEIEDQTACHDSIGREFDGSTVGADPHSFCISAHRLAKRVDAREIRKQALALILHEISEISGFSDEQAIQLQKEVLARTQAQDTFGLTAP